MDLTVAYFHPLLHAEVVKHDFEQIRAMGAGSIVYAIHEQEAQRWPRDLERGLRQAQDAGLKVYLSLGRYGNLFAGPLVVPSWYTFHHPKSRVMDRHGRYHDISCFNHQSFRAWLFKEIEHYLRTYPINGILLDEPRGPDITCFCSVCRALCHILNAEPDEVASYYYWRNNEDPARVWQTTRRLLRRIPRRQLHWQFPLASH